LVSVERIQLLQRLRLEDEERRKKELLEKQRKEKQEQELRKKREAGKNSPLYYAYGMNNSLLLPVY